MTIRMLKAWNGLPEQLVTTLSSSEESRLVGLGLASFDLDGPAENVRMAQLATDGAGNLVYLGVPSRAKSVVIFGDSITSINASSGAGYSYSPSHGYWNWANFLLGQRYKLLRNAGVGGNWTQDMLTRIDSDVIAYRPDMVIVLGGTNDIANEVPVATITTNLATIYEKILAAGCSVVAMTILPRAAGITAAQRSRLMCVNNWIREMAYTRPNIVLCDPFVAFSDPASATSDPVAGYTSDGLHPNSVGARIIGAELYKVLNALTPASNRLVSGQADVFDSANNPTGNMLVNGMMQTLSATSGTGYAGNNPNSFTIQRISGTSTWTGSAVARSDGVPGNWYRAAVTGGTLATEQFEFRQNVSGPTAGGATYQIGDRLYAELEINVTVSGSAPYLNQLCIQVVEYDRDGAAMISVASVYKNGTDKQLSSNFSGVARTPIFTATGAGGSGASQRCTVSVQMVFDGTISSAITVDMARMSLRKAV